MQNISKLVDSDVQVHTLHISRNWFIKATKYYDSTLNITTKWTRIESAVSI